MALVIPVAHDFICPWCWIMVSQVRRLRMEFDVQFEFRAFELFPEELPWPEDGPAPVPSKRPKTPSRFALAAAAEGIAYPTVKRPKHMRTHNAHQAVLHAKAITGDDWPLMERLYEALWLRGEEINALPVILKLADGLVPSLNDLKNAIENRRYKSQIVGFDDDAYAAGVYNVPTYFVGGEKLAEQPYDALREAVAREIANQKVYNDLNLPSPPAGRPAIVMNMITTIDGKTISGERDEHVMDLGSRLDHATLRQIEGAVDAVIIGAGTLRATPKIQYSNHLVRIVATERGELDFEHKFFHDPGHAAILSPRDPAGRPEHVLWLDSSAGLAPAMTKLHEELSVERVVLEGGSELNAAFLHADLVDEIFFTIAPTVKLGREVPTMAGGDPLPRAEMRGFELVSVKSVADEVFLRYRRATTGPVGS